MNRKIVSRTTLVIATIAVLAATILVGQAMVTNSAYARGRVGGGGGEIGGTSNSGNNAAFNFNSGNALSFGGGSHSQIYQHNDQSSILNLQAK